MPFVRYQKFDADGITNFSSISTIRGAYTTKAEVGVCNRAYNAMITAALSDTKSSSIEGINALNVGVQFQF